MENKKLLLWLSLVCLLIFTSIRSVSFIRADQQKKLIVYNVPKHRAIDLVEGRNTVFIGDSDLMANKSLESFHLRPARIGNRIRSIIFNPVKHFEFQGRHIWIIDSSLKFVPIGKRQVIDLLILSGNPRFYVSDFVKSFIVMQVVVDASVPTWKSALWKKDCDSFRIPCHVVSERGAFIVPL